MPRVTFDFRPAGAGVGRNWTMGPACGNPSNNPAPTTNPVIYIIHNSSVDNTTYVGYADDAEHRWRTRTEVFHCFGINQALGQQMLCACCVPVSNAHIFLKGMHGCEHLLIRAVFGALLGVTDVTNTQLVNTPFNNANVTSVRVRLPTDPWGHLAGDVNQNVGAHY